ncbi:hypothetical protein GFS31_37270 [Leptolyngbya sp. BL0902]|nr:hypothetical protein GFS31_37270 [Leptolyngbya sp. BL0902]
MGLGLGLLLSGCQTLGLAGSSPDGAIESGNQFVSRSVRGSQLISRTLPASLSLRRGWQMAPPQTLHPNADLQAYHPGQAIFLVVLGESKTSVASGTLEQQALQYLQIMRRSFDQVTSPESRTGVAQISSYPAVQYAFQAAVRGESVAYLHTTVEMGEYYYQVVAWTRADRYPANADEMRAIVQGFGPD